jgi:hypothetical protein
MSWKDSIKKEDTRIRSHRPKPNKKVSELLSYTHDLDEMLKEIRMYLRPLTQKHRSRVDEGEVLEFFNKEIQKVKEKLEEVFEDM